jgi:hypothetical protein
LDSGIDIIFGHGDLTAIFDIAFGVVFGWFSGIMG